MIVPTHQDARILLGLREEPLGISYLNHVAGGLCQARGEPPVVVRWAVAVKQAIFHPAKWVIVLPRMAVLDFLHEVGHMLSVLDRGRSGTEKDAEAFAHGVSAWLWPDKYGMDGSVSWQLAQDPLVSQIIWTCQHLERISKD